MGWGKKSVAVGRESQKKYRVLNKETIWECKKRVGMWGWHIGAGDILEHRVD